VTDDLRREALLAHRSASVADRLRVAFELGDADVRAYCSAHGVTPGEAARQFRRQRQEGRRPSALPD
jgi:hypothetical protein